MWSAALLTGSIIVGTSRLSAGVIAALGVGALSSLFVYRRFGQVYAAIGSLACAALIPFQFSLAEPIARVLSASVLVAALLIARRVRRDHADDIAADDAAIVNATAFAGLYLLDSDWPPTNVANLTNMATP